MRGLNTFNSEQNLTLDLLEAEKTLDVNETAKKLSVSTATIRNWVKLGRIKKINTSGKKLLFEEHEVEKLLSDIITGKSDKLTKRRNKKAIKGLNLYADYIEDDGKNILIGSELVKKDSALYTAIHTDLHTDTYPDQDPNQDQYPDPYPEKNIRILIATLALKLYLQSAKLPYISLQVFIAQNKNDCISKLLRELLHNIDISQLGTYQNVPTPTFIPYQDFLGFIYISVSSISYRKSTGSYFTPINIVNKLLDSVKASTQFNNGNIIDLCCGTGNFLLASLKRGASIERLYGNDIDEISVSIAKLNLCINGINNINTLNEHIRKVDSLLNRDTRKYDLVIGNPPWGYVYSETEINKLLNSYKTASKKGSESYDLFMELSLNIINQNGLIAYVLPEAILNVKAHQKIRCFIKNTSSIKFVSYIGNPFTGVACPCILIVLKKDGEGSTIGCNIETNNLRFTINKNRDLSEEYWNFDLSDEDVDCLEKLTNVKNGFTLKNQADFALGIVTGANKKYISNTKNPQNEMILKGSNLHKYYFDNSNSYIHFVPNTFQQVAPIEMYRAKEKLIYRFICEAPVFSYDANQTLSLNSANILIPHVTGISMKYILAILNSRTITYWCRKKYNSVKLLRSHIEEIPFPTPSSEEQNTIVKLVDNLLSLENHCTLDKTTLYNEIEEHVMRLYNLNNSEKEIINSFSSQFDSFLK
ncbi:DNA binding domain, excisionase family [Gardnerella vaginalis]|uniref:site-specific DNA-methyltransferase (adenine-specific) n=1 Tax=Gardnerella vaginalis TaxID=2702 RepID=A0A135Z3J0_GARVA|nr:TaqI-like C-terminal specificity domain-containing protein [Gardnerella vaginalis]KXI16196.1 DNA binding domain, excisionase family [Gardnerella vaginalis]